MARLVSGTAVWRGIIAAASISAAAVGATGIFESDRSLADDDDRQHATEHDRGIYAAIYCRCGCVDHDDVPVYVSCRVHTPMRASAGSTTSKHPQITLHGSDQCIMRYR